LTVRLVASSLGGVKLRRGVIWTLAVSLLLGWSAPTPRADVRATSSVDALAGTTDVGVDVDHASALLDTSATSVRAKAPTRSPHAPAPSRRADDGPTCAPLERARWAASPPVAGVPLYALHHVYRV